MLCPPCTDSLHNIILWTFGQTVLKAQLHGLYTAGDFELLLYHDFVIVFNNTNIYTNTPFHC